MKNLSPFLICFFILTSCASEASNTNSQSESVKTASPEENAKIENFDCTTFFTQGDYSSICFIDGKLPDYLEGGCIYSFITKGDKHEEDLKIQFTDKNSTMLAEMHLDLNKNNYKKGSITEVSNAGDAAFFDVYSKGEKSFSRSHKDLHVRYMNITFVLFASYQTNKAMPCFYTDEELISFANNIIENL